MKIIPTPVRWELIFSRYHSLNIYIEARHQRNGSIKYSVKASDNSFLHKTELMFFLDPSESHIDQEYIDGTRLNSYEECVDMFHKYLEKQSKESNPEIRYKQIKDYFKALSQNGKSPVKTKN